MVQKREAAVFYADGGQLLTSDQIWAFSRQLSPDFLFVFWPRMVAYNSIMSCSLQVAGGKPVFFYIYKLSSSF